MTYQIYSNRTGLRLGEYPATSMEEALAAYARDAGYPNFAALAETIGKTEAAALAELTVLVLG